MHVMCCCLFIVSVMNNLAGVHNASVICQLDSCGIHNIHKGMYHLCVLIDMIVCMLACQSRYLCQPL